MSPPSVKDAFQPMSSTYPATLANYKPNLIKKAFCHHSLTDYCASQQITKLTFWPASKYLDVLGLITTYHFNKNLDSSYAK